MIIGPNKEKVKAYKAGPAKLLATLDVSAAAWNSKLISQFLIAISTRSRIHLIQFWTFDQGIEVIHVVIGK